MMAGPSILFVCNMNSIRSPMAEALASQILGPGPCIESCGVYEGALDPFVKRVLDEEDAPVPPRAPRTFADIDISRFDRVIALTPEAAAEARRLGGQVMYWDVENPTDTRGSEEEIVEAYRRCRDQLSQQIRSELKKSG